MKAIPDVDIWRCIYSSLYLYFNFNTASLTRLRSRENVFFNDLVLDENGLSLDDDADLRR